MQYSDDLVILAKNTKEFQNHLDKILSHCNDMELVINSDTTKIQIFQKDRLPDEDKTSNSP